MQEGLDILPILTEEGYLKAYPEERKCRAFLEFCREGDVMALVGLLQDDSDDEGEDVERGQSGQAMRQIDVLRYQDPMGEMQSGLHAAVASGSREVAWLLLLLASELSMDQFPPQALQEASAMGFSRTNSTGKIDIRSLRDARGRSAEQLAAEGGGWHDWLGTGRLTV